MDDDLIKEVKDAVEASEATYKEWRKQGRETLLMKAGEPTAHWPGDTLRERELEGLPALVVNQLPQFSQRVVGAFRQNQFAISLTAGEASDEPTRETMEGLIRAIQYDSVAKVAYRVGLQNGVDTGLGWLRVKREYESNDSWDQVLRVSPVYNTFSVYPDAVSRRWDLEDARCLAVLEEVHEDEFKRLYKGASTKDLDAGTGDRKRSWANQKDKTVTRAEYWRKVPTTKKLALVGPPESPGSWETVEITKESQLFNDAGMMVQTPYGESDLFLVTPVGPVPIIRQREVKTMQLEVGLVSGGDVLEKMRPDIGQLFPFAMVLGEEVFVDGERRIWGVLQHAKDPQRVWNFQWSAAVEAVQQQPKVPYKMTPDMIAGHEDEWATINQQRKPYVLFNPDTVLGAYTPQREAPPVTPVASLALVEKAEAMLNSATGVNAETLGEATNAKSGVAIQSRQYVGNLVTATYPDNLTLAMEHLTRVLLERIPYVYDTERTIRILGPDYESSRPVRINGTGMPNLTQGRYDVLAKIGPSFTTQRESTMVQMTEMGRNMGNDAFTMLADKIVDLSDIPRKDEVVKRIKAIQAMMGFSEDGQPPPQMMDNILKAVQAAIKQQAPTPEQVQNVVLKTLEEIEAGRDPTILTKPKNPGAPPGMTPGMPPEMEPQ